jgi:hypothetical protein
MEKGFENTTYDYEGAQSMKYIAEFFKNIKWWNMKPHPELVLEYPQQFCLSKPGEEYIIYLRYAGVAKIRMEASAVSQKYSCQWFDPETGKYYDARLIQGAEVMQFSCPESFPSVPGYKDWVLYIRKALD